MNSFVGPVGTFDVLDAFFATTSVIIVAITLVLVIAYAVLGIVAKWKIFEKSGRAGWKALIPYYNKFVLADLTWGSGWIFLVPLVSQFLLRSWVLIIVAVAYNAITCYKLAKAFGTGAGMAVGLFFFGPVFQMILAFGNYQYIGVPQDRLCLSGLGKKVPPQTEPDSDLN